MQTGCCQRRVVPRRIGGVIHEPRSAVPIRFLTCTDVVFGVDPVTLGKVILASLIFFGLMSAATALTTDIMWFSILRVLTSLGLGAALPNATTLVSEYANSRRRSHMMAVTYCGMTLGGAVAGYLTNLFIQVASWHWALVVGGILPLLCAAVVAVALPESPKFLARQPERQGELVALMNRVVPEQFPADTRFLLDEPAVATKVPVAGLVDRRFQLGTITIWAGFVCAFFIVYLMNSWLPILMTDVGFSLAAAATMGLLLQAGGTIGNLVIGWLMDRLGCTARSPSRWPAPVSCSCSSRSLRRTRSSSAS